MTEASLPLQAAFSGLHRVLCRLEKTFVIDLAGGQITGSIDRLKPSPMAKFIPADVTPSTSPGPAPTYPASHKLTVRNPVTHLPGSLEAAHNAEPPH
nr:unnamed protein product [Fasciola hepatica]